MPKYQQGKFTPAHPEKYVGDPSKIFWRSSWEKKCFLFFDNTENILKWSSETTIVPYLCPVRGDMHRYFVDMTVLYRTRSGEIKKALVEVKPKSQTAPPKKPKKMTPRYVEEVKTYMINQAKWKAANQWAVNHNFTFMVLTEDHIFGAKK